MRTQRTLVLLFGAAMAAASIPAGSQEAEGTAPVARTPSASRDARKFLAPADQVVAIRAARLFDSRSGKMLANPVIIVRGERIAEVGAGVPLARAAVREAKLHGVDWIKIYTTQDFVGPVHMWRPDATLVNSPSLTLEEVEAIVDEAHRLGLKVACHTYGGEGMRSCLSAGVDSPNHLLELDDPGVQLLLQKQLFFVPTIDDLISLEKADLRETGGRNSRLRLMEQAFKKALAAGVTIVFGSCATAATLPHGRQADQFDYFVKWGMTPAQALQTAYLPAARMLNYGWESQIGSIEKGKFADIIAVAGDPLADVGEMEKVRFVMKGGLVVRNELGAR